MRDRRGVRVIVSDVFIGCMGQCNEAKGNTRGCIAWRFWNMVH